MPRAAVDPVARSSGTGRPSSSPSRCATGASESAALNRPSLGRPRCEVTITAPPRDERVADRRHRRADARVVGDRACVVLRHVQVGADEDALAGDVDVGQATGMSQPCRAEVRRVRASRRQRRRLFRRHQRHGRVEHPIAEAPFVVVPGRDLDQASRHLGQRRIEHRRAGSWLKSTDTSGAVL